MNAPLNSTNDRIFHYWVLVVTSEPYFPLLGLGGIWNQWILHCQSAFCRKKTFARKIIDITVVAAAIAAAWPNGGGGLRHCCHHSHVPIQLRLYLNIVITHSDSFSSKYGNITTGASGGRNVYIVGHSCQSWHHSCQIWHHSWLTPLVMPDLALVMPGLALVTYNIHIPAAGGVVILPYLDENELAAVASSSIGSHWIGTAMAEASSSITLAMAAATAAISIIFRKMFFFPAKSTLTMQNPLISNTTKTQ